MTQKPKFWIAMAIFQVIFGLTVFGITRHFYQVDGEIVSFEPAVTNQSAFEWPDSGPKYESEQLDLSTFTQSTSTTENPAELLRQANEFFAGRQYDRAAEMYQRVLAFDPSNVDYYNNLGITLHYLGRSNEALRRLDEGVALDPLHQRIWLTIGFVNSQLGNIDRARTALTNAVERGAENEIGQTAARMLDELP